MNLSPSFDMITFSIRLRTFLAPVVLATPRAAQASLGDVHDATRRRTPTRRSCRWRTWAARRTTCRCWEEIRTRRWELTREERASPHTTTTIRYTVTIRNPNIWIPETFENQFLRRSVFKRSTIQKPDILSGIQIPTFQSHSEILIPHYSIQLKTEQVCCLIFEWSA